MVKLTSDRSALQGRTTRTKVVRTLAAIFLFLLPLAYVAYLSATVIHEVLGHGLTSLMFGGRFHGFVIHADGLGYAVIDGYEGHEVAVLAAGVVVSLVVGMALLILSTRTRRPLFGVALLLFAAMLLESATTYAAWGSLSAQAPSDFGRIVRLLGGPKTTTHVALSVGFGVAWMATTVLWMRALLRRLEDLLGPLAMARAIAVYLCFAALDAGFWLLFDWNQVTPGLGRTPAQVGIALDCAVLAVLMAKRRTAVEPMIVTRTHWCRAVIGTWAGAAAVVAILLATSNTGAGASASDSPHRSRRGVSDDGPFRRYVDELRAAGRPTSLRQLAGEGPRDAENAAPELQAVLDAINERFGTESTWPRIGPWGTSDVRLEDETPERIAELRTFLAPFGQYFARVASALDRPRCRFPIRGPDGFEDAKGTATVRHLARLLGAQSVVAAEPAERIESARTLLRLAEKNEPVLVIDWMVGPAAAVQAIKGIGSGVETGALDATTTRAAVDGVLRDDWTSRGPKWLIANVTQTVSMVRAALDGDVPADVERIIEMSTFRATAPLVEGLRVVDAAARVQPASRAEYLRSALAFQEQLAAAKDTHAFVVGKGVQLLVRADAASRLARVALAVADRRARTGQFPASLNELATDFSGDVPTDPFTGAPFVYERTDSGVRIASLGRLPEEIPHEEDERTERGLVWELHR